MSPLPTLVNCPHPRLVKLVQFKGEHVIYYRCELWGAHVTIPEQSDDPAGYGLKLLSVILDALRSQRILPWLADQLELKYGL